MWYLQLHVRQDVMGQLQTTLTQGYDGLQLSTLCSCLQVKHGGVLIPLLIPLTETARFMVPHHRQMDLGKNRGRPEYVQNMKLTQLRAEMSVFRTSHDYLDSQ